MRTPTRRLGSEHWGALAAMLVALPSAIAFGVTIFAPLGGAHAAEGAIAGVIGAIALGVIAPLLGGTPRLISAPCAPAAAVLAGFSAQLVADGVAATTVVVLLLVATLGCGVLQLALGLLRVGQLIKYMPYPVVSGYLSGVGLVLIVSQLPKLLGVNADDDLTTILTAPEAWDRRALTVGLATILVMVGAGRVTRRVPAAILGLAAGVLVYFTLGLRDPSMLRVDNPLVVGPLVASSGDLGVAAMERLRTLTALDGSMIALAAGTALTLAVLLSINTPPPNWAGGDRGFAAIPGGEDRFRRDFKRALRYAERLKPTHIHIMAGTADGPAARDTFISNLTWAAAEAPKQSLTIEPINPTDMPGYFLDDFETAAVVLAEVNAPNLGLQFDAYHAQIITGDAMRAWSTYRHLVRHVQVGGVPGRHEPEPGEIDYPAFFAQLDADGYTGVVSGEYNPKGRTEDGLNWIRSPQ